MYYETTQTVGPGWHNRSYKPTHYEDMTWSPPRHFPSPGSSPETYRRIIHSEDDDDLPRRAKERRDDDFFRRSSPTFPRRIFKEVWSDSDHRFGERPKMFKKVFRPNRSWDEDFDRDIERVRRLDKEFDTDMRHKDFRTRDLKRDIEEEFEKAAGRVHHIPIMVERKIEEMKSRFGKNSPPQSPSSTEEPEIPHVNRLRKNFEHEKEKPRWDTVHTLPTRKHTQPTKSVFRSYSETHEDVPKQHSAAYRSHSDGHCPNKTYVTKIEVNLPPEPTCSKQELPKVEETKDPSLLQIAAVLQNVEDLVNRVDAYSGTGRDKHYRFLDEMLTRCMLRLDDVDTEGREDVRNARRAAVREVQSCIDKLEAKADESERLHKQKSTNSKKPNENNEITETPKQEKDKQQEEPMDNSDVEDTKL